MGGDRVVSVLFFLGCEGLKGTCAAKPGRCED
jgi:hypothetical protein